MQSNSVNPYSASSSSEPLRQSGLFRPLLLLSVMLFIVAILGLVAHVGMLWVVVDRDTAGFAVGLRNLNIVGPESAHGVGILAHVIGIVLSAVVCFGAITLVRNRNPRLCVLLGLGVSIPALSPLFGLAFPLGIAAILIGIRNCRRSIEPNIDT